MLSIIGARGSVGAHRALFILFAQMISARGSVRAYRALVRTYRALVPMGNTFRKPIEGFPL
jgi:hypothetical protein